MALTGGPLRDFRWGGLTLRPTADGEAEWQTTGLEFESEASPNGDPYSTGKAVIGYVQQECAMTTEEFRDFKALQDGVSRSGIATTMDGQVLSMNGIIEGEMILANGKVTVKIAGKVRVQ
jgi:hypothetical protein